MANLSPTVNQSREEKDLVLRVGSFEIDWPKALGYFGGIWLAVAYDVIAPPLAIWTWVGSSLVKVAFGIPPLLRASSYRSFSSQLCRT
jgi:hypothetical protein